MCFHFFGENLIVSFCCQINIMKFESQRFDLGLGLLIQTLWTTLKYWFPLIRQCKNCFLFYK